MDDSQVLKINSSKIEKNTKVELLGLPKVDLADLLKDLGFLEIYQVQLCHL